MFVKSKHARGVSKKTLVRAVLYAYISPTNGYLIKLRERFGYSARLLLNSELALGVILKNIPGRQPGMSVVIDASLIRRFGTIIEKLGLQTLIYKGEKELLTHSCSKRVLAIIIPDSYHAMTQRNKNKFEKTSPIKIIYQNRKRPKSVDLIHDVYIWETRLLPRTVSGAVVSFYTDDLTAVREALRNTNTSKDKLPAASFIREIYWGTKSYENKYRRVDKSPPKILARMLYDFYK